MQEKQKIIDEIDILTLPPRSERGLVEEEELSSRIGINRQKERIKENIRMRHFIIRILLCLFIPIPFGFVVYRYYPQLFDVFKQDSAISHSIFETVHISRAEEREADEKEAEQANTKETEHESSGEENEQAPDENYMYYTVKEGDTIYKISMKHFGSRDGEEIIRKANDLGPEELVPGQRIRIPKSSHN